MSAIASFRHGMRALSTALGLRRIQSQGELSKRFIVAPSDSGLIVGHSVLTLPPGGTAAKKPGAIARPTTTIRIVGNCTKYGFHPQRRSAVLI
jgi:hypothetical protein